MEGLDPRVYETEQDEMNLILKTGNLVVVSSESLDSFGWVGN